MKSYLLLLISFLTICCGGKTNKDSVNNADSSWVNNQSRSENIKPDTTVHYDSSRENLKLSLPDTIKVNKSFYFTNNQIKDSFVLTIQPGLVSKSKSKLEIITKDGDKIYSQVFDSYYFIRRIFQPDSIPSKYTRNQKAFEQYLMMYRKSLTQNQIDSYFKKSVEKFYDNGIYFMKSSRYNSLSNLGYNIDNIDKNGLNEILSDSTIRVIDISCFDCDEGAEMIFYSKKKNQLVQLLSHD